MCFIASHKIWSATDELGDSWSVENELREKLYIQPIELRGIDPGDKILQIFAYAFEIESGESGKD